MPKYIKETPRITVKYINAATEETILEVTDRSWMNVGELFTINIMNSLVMQELKNKSLAKNVIVIAMGEFKLIAD